MYADSIRAYRLKHRMSQQALADELGVSAVAVSKWERGQTQPGIQALTRMADIFGVTVDDLVGREPPVAAPEEDNVRVMTRAFRQLTAEEQEKFLAVGRALFSHAFGSPKDGGDA
jgi:transcriptional regulator with XRE-family HTH domain